MDKKKEEESFKNQTEQFMMDNSNTMKKMDKERWPSMIKHTKVISLTVISMAMEFATTAMEISMKELSSKTRDKGKESYISQDSTMSMKEISSMIRWKDTEK